MNTERVFDVLAKKRKPDNGNGPKGEQVPEHIRRRRTRRPDQRPNGKRRPRE